MKFKIFQGHWVIFNVFFAEFRLLSRLKLQNLQFQGFSRFHCIKFRWTMLWKRSKMENCLPNLAEKPLYYLNLTFIFAPLLGGQEVKKGGKKGRPPKKGQFGRYGSQEAPISFPKLSHLGKWHGGHFCATFVPLH